MALPIKYNNTTSEANALRESDFWIGVGDIARAPTSTTGFWNGITPPDGGYTIYLNKGSNGPSIYCPSNDTELITITNKIAGSSYTTAGDCLDYFVRQSDKMCINFDYPVIVTEDLFFNFDANYTASYPKISTSGYDVSQKNRSIDLLNGITFNTDGYFSMDGSDDSIRVSVAIAVVANATVVFWMRTTDNTWLMIRGNDNQSYYLGAINNGSGWYNANCGNPDYYVDTNLSNNPQNEGYLDGKFHMFEAKNVDLTSWNIYDFFHYGAGSSFAMLGDVACIRVYARTLTNDESNQNYYQGPIVTNGLSYMWDSGNIISYPRSGTITYDLLKTINASLVNGTTFKSGYGGYWQFDGSNDKILLDSSIYLGDGNTGWTVNAWVRTTSNQTGLGYGPILTNQSGGPVYSSMCINSGKITYWVYPSNINNWNSFSGNITVNDGKWHMLTWVNKIGYTMDMYVDGVLDVTVGPTNAGNNNPVDIIGASWVGTFNGDISIVNIYTESLSKAEILKNLNAQRTRFGV